MIQILGAFLILLGLVLTSQGFTSYVDGSCAAGPCAFEKNVNPIMIIIGLAVAGGGLAIFTGRLLKGMR